MLLDINKFIEENELKFVTTSNLFIKDKYDPNGLFSNVIFGVQGSKRWRNTYAAISLNCKIIHPLLFDIINRRCSQFLKLFSGEASMVRTTNGYEYQTNGSGEWGIDVFIDNFDILLPFLMTIPGLTENGKKLLRFIRFHKETSFISNNIVIPPLFRPATMKGTEVEVHPLNDLYIEIIRDCQLIKTTPSGVARKKILMKIQVTNHKVFRELESWVKGKFGLTRSSLLGKTLDFSGRAVIIGDMNLNSDQIGVPYKMVVVLFTPFIIYKALHGYKSSFERLNFTPSIMNLNKLIKDIKEGSIDVSPEINNLVIEICKEICEEKVVLAKRDPSLYRLSVRAYRPVIVMDSTIHLNNLVTDGHGADYDGDQMAIIVPMTDAAQQEAKEKMLVQNNLFDPTGKLTMSLKIDFILGFYYLSLPPIETPKPYAIANDISDLLRLLYSGYHPNGVVVYNKKEYALGRAILTHYTGVEITEVYNKKNLGALMNSLPTRFSSDEVVQRINDIHRCVGRVPALMGKTMSPDDFKPSQAITDKITASINDGTFASQIETLTNEFIEEKKQQGAAIYDMYASGARGDKIQIQQTSIAKGYITDITGKTTKEPVKGNLNDGLTSEEYFGASVGARKGIADRSISTSVTGYLMRKYIYAMSAVKYNPRLTNCGTDHFLTIDVKDDNVASAVKGRYLNNGKLITNGKELIGQTIQIYSPMGCKSLELCKRCAGETSLTNLGVSNIGIVSAQLLGERGTQLSMKVFHMGGASNIKSFLVEHPRLKDVCSQNNAEISSTIPFKIYIASDEYNITDDGYITSSVMMIKANDFEFELDLNYDLGIMVDESQVEYDELDNMMITIPENQMFGSMRFSSTDVVKVVKQIIRFMDNKSLLNTDLLFKLWETFALVEVLPLLPFEILVSQLHRDPLNPAFPYRMSNYKNPPMRVGIKKVAVLENWKRGAAFENVGEALHYAVLNNPGDNIIKSDLDDLRDL